MICLASLREYLAAQSDESFQRRGWLTQSPTDTALGDILEDPVVDSVLGIAAANTLRELEYAIRCVDSQQPVRELIGGAEMRGVRKLALRALQEPPVE